MTSDTIAILSPGEMGHAIGRVLVNHGFRVITSLAGRSRRTADLSQAAGIEDVGNLDCLVDQADFILSIMPSAAAPVVASEVASRLSIRGRTLTFCKSATQSRPRPCARSKAPSLAPEAFWWTLVSSAVPRLTRINHDCMLPGRTSTVFCD